MSDEPVKPSPWKVIGDYLLANFKLEILKWLFAKIFRNAPMMGLRGWLFKMAFNLFWDRFAEPAIEYAIRKGLLAVDKHKGNVQIKKLKEARDTNDGGAYDKISDDIFK